MSKKKQTTIRTVCACIVGILMWICSFGLITDILLQLGLPYDNFIKYSMVVPCIVIGIRSSLAVRTGKINGGVSRKVNILSVCWLIYFIMVGSVGTILQIFIDMVFSNEFWLKEIVIGLLVIGSGVLLLVKLRLIDNNTE